MLNNQQLVASGPDLKISVRKSLDAIEPDGIAPELEGRICNPIRDEFPAWWWTASDGMLARRVV